MKPIRLFQLFPERCCGCSAMLERWLFCERRFVVTCLECPRCCTTLYRTQRTWLQWIVRGVLMTGIYVLAIVTLYFCFMAFVVFGGN